MENELMQPTNAPAALFSSVSGGTQIDRLKVFQAVSDSLPLDDNIGAVIAVRNVIIQPVGVVDSSTGEDVTRNRIVLIDEDGTAYGCTSTGVETSVKNLFDIVGCPPWDPSIKLVPTKRQGRNGYKFTTLVWAGE